jgi:pyoverdine/dityrosine biosynthesis protein Dit1
MKTLNSLYNDITLVYDLGNKTWTTDTRRLYNDVVIVNNKTYAGSSISASIVEANV